MVLNDAGVIGLSLNGKSFPATQPYTGKVGDTVMVNYFNEGLLAHPMHLHQPVGWIIAKDGKELLVPMPGDTINIAPGERYTVLYKLDRPRRVGLALPHPHPRRGRRRDVRHGHRVHRRGAMNDRITCRLRRIPILVCRSRVGSHRGSRPGMRRLNILSCVASAADVRSGCETIADQLRSRHPHVVSEATTVVGAPREALVEASAAADLLVVGKTGSRAR